MLYEVITSLVGAGRLDEAAPVLHDVPALVNAFAAAREHSGQPTVILAHTVMGKGVSYMADDYRWHGKPPKMEQAETALAELGTTYAEWSARLLGH